VVAAFGARYRRAAQFWADCGAALGPMLREAIDNERRLADP
jgi:hypothetical protein